MNLEQFLGIVFRDVKDPAKHGVVVIADAAEGFQTRRWRRGMTADGRTLYVCISTVKDKPRAQILGRRTEDLVLTWAIVLDDVGTKVNDALIKLDPSLVTETSPNNFQYWYLLKYGVDPAKAAALIEGIARAGLTDMGARRADRIMRVPGSVNRKPELAEPFETRVVHYVEGLTYTLSEIEVGLGVTSTEPRSIGSRPPSLAEGERDPVFEWLLEHGYVIEGPNPRGWYAIHCPREHEHTGEVDHGTDYMPGRPGVVKCLHSHGAEVTTEWLRQWILEQDPGADLGIIPRDDMQAFSRDLLKAIGGSPEGAPTTTLFGPTPANQRAVGAAEGLAERLAAAIRDVPLGPWLLSDFDTTAAGNPRQSQTVTAVRVYDVMRLVGMEVYWNALTRKVEAEFPETVPWYWPEDDLQGAAVATLRHACARCGLKGDGAIDDYATARALERPFNPVLDWMREERWDGEDRIQRLAMTLTMQDPTMIEWRDVVVRRWLIQTVVAAKNYDRYGCARDVGYVPMLQGEQGLGKSKWVKSLMPAPWVSDGVSLKLDGNERDSVMRATMTPIVELGEVDATFRRSDVAALKNFCTRTEDRYRLPWGRREIVMPRITTFIATVNPSDFLNDPSGERRFWPLAVSHVMFEHGINLQQLWAQALALEEAGEQYWLTDREQEMHAKAAEPHHGTTQLTEVVADLRRRRQVTPETQWQHVQSGDILRHYGIKPDKLNYSELRAHLVRAKFQETKVKGTRGWWIPPYVAPLSDAQRAQFNLIKGGKTD